MSLSKSTGVPVCSGKAWQENTFPSVPALGKAINQLNLTCLFPTHHFFDCSFCASYLMSLHQNWGKRQVLTAGNFEYRYFYPCLCSLKFKPPSDDSSSTSAVYTRDFLCVLTSWDHFGNKCFLLFLFSHKCVILCYTIQSVSQSKSKSIKSTVIWWLFMHIMLHELLFNIGLLRLFFIDASLLYHKRI